MGNTYVCHTFKPQFILDKIFWKTCESTKNQPFQSVKQLFQTTERLIEDQVETTSLSTIDWNHPVWRETSLLCDSTVHLMNSNTCVFADSVLCLGSLSDYLVKAWKDKIKWYLDRKCKKKKRKDVWSFLRFGCENKRYGTHVNKPDGEWDRTTESMMLNFVESGHPVFLATRALGRGELLKQRERKEVHSLQRKKPLK